jgi:hypothetical protein
MRAASTGSVLRRVCVRGVSHTRACAAVRMEVEVHLKWQGCSLIQHFTTWTTLHGHARTRYQQLLQYQLRISIKDKIIEIKNKYIFWTGASLCLRHRN